MSGLLLKPGSIDYGILSDDARWADPYDCVDLLVAGTRFLHETMSARYPRCSLLKRIIRLGDEYARLKGVVRGGAAQVTPAQLGFLYSEMNILGTLGHSLWHLQQHLDIPAVRYELKELSQIGCGEDAEGDRLRLRGQGFLFLASANLLKQGFELEFIPRRKDERTPDFHARRDGKTFSCEVTNRHPQSGDFRSVDFFWTTVYNTVDLKKDQLAQAQFPNGVLIIDCTPVWDAFGLGQFTVGGQLVYHVPPEQGGPRTGSVPLIRYDESEHSAGLRALEDLIRGSSMQTLILWKHNVEVFEEGFRREMMYRVVGTMHAAAFWSYFPRAFVFPGPHVEVKWD